MNPFRWFLPTEVRFGAGEFNRFGEWAAPYGRRPLVVTGRRSARRTGLLDRTLAQFPDAVVFDEVDENPATDVCEAGAEVCREKDCDFVIGLGGGSPMDAAKAIAVLARNPGPCRRYYGADKFAEPNLPILVAPTTAGTGSEVTPYAVITDTETGMKRTISGRTLFPALALLDPELTVTMPRSVTVNTGLDALSQAMEGMVSRSSTPVGDVLALEACRIIREWLPRAVRRGDDLEARSRMLHAAMLAGAVIAQSGTTLVHGMGYYYTLEYGVAHGLANALLLTPLFQYNAYHEPKKVAALAEALGHPTPPEPEAARDSIGRALHDLLRELDVSPAAGEAGVESNRFEEFTDELAGDPYRFRNQPGTVTRDDVFRFFQESYAGTRT